MAIYFMAVFFCYYLSNTPVPNIILSRFVAKETGTGILALRGIVIN